MITPPVVAPQGSRVFEARKSYVTAVRLSSANVDEVRLWVHAETGSDCLWNDGALYFTSPGGLAHAKEGDYIVQTVLGFEAYIPAQFGAKYDLVQYATGGPLKKSEPNVATWPLDSGCCNSGPRSHANPLCGPHKDAESFEGKTMVNPTVQRIALDEFSVTAAVERAQQRRHAEARGEA